jgi:hypothetical protein
MLDDELNGDFVIPENIQIINNFRDPIFSRLLTHLKDNNWGTHSSITTVRISQDSKSICFSCKGFRLVNISNTSNLITWR